MPGDAGLVGSPGSLKGVVGVARSGQFGRVTLVFLATTLAFVAAGCDWPMFRYGPSHTGFNPLEQTINVANVPTLAPRFVASIRAGFSSPSVANGVVYVGSDDGRLYAFDAAGTTNCSGSPKSCSPLWVGTLGSENNVESSPVVANGVVYVGSDAGNAEAFDAAGTTKCSGTTRTCMPLWFAYVGAARSAAVANGIVYFAGNDDDFNGLHAFALP